MKIRIKKYWFIIFIYLISCSQAENNLKKSKKELIDSVNYEKINSNSINKEKQELTIQKDYFKKMLNLYPKKDLELKNNLDFIEQFVSVLNYQNDSLISNSDSLICKYYNLISSKDEATYSCTECYNKKKEISYYEIPEYGRISLTRFENTLKPGCSDFNLYLIINSRKKEIIIIFAHVIKIKTNGTIEFVINVRGTKGNPNKIRYSLKNKFFMHAAYPPPPCTALSTSISKKKARKL